MMTVSSTLPPIRSGERDTAATAMGAHNGRVKLAGGQQDGEAAGERLRG